MRGAARATARARDRAAVAALAAALACRCQGEPVRAIEALASVVVNRLRAARSRRAPPGWGVDLAAALASSGLAARPGAAAADPPDAFAEACRRIAARAVAGTLPDPTGGALHWHEADAPPPDDAPRGAAVRLGRFVFIRPADADPAPGTGAAP